MANVNAAVMFLNLLPLISIFASSKATRALLMLPNSSPRLSWKASRSGTSLRRRPCLSLSCRISLFPWIKLNKVDRSCLTMAKTTA